MSTPIHDLARSLLAVAVTCGLLALPSTALAQAVDIPAVVTSQMDQNTWTFAAFTQQFESDLDDAAGDMSRSGVMAGLGHRFELNEDWYIVLQGNYIGSYYDFSRDAGQGGGGATYRWKDTHTVTLVGLVGWKATDKLTWLGGGIFKNSEEAGATDDAATGGGLVGFSYAQSDTLTYGLLIGAISQIEDDAAIVPIPTVSWKFADAWKFDFGILGSLGHPGVGPELSYRASDNWQFGFGLAFQKRRFRLDNHINNGARGPNPNINGVGQETSVPIYARARWAPSRTMFFDLFSGITVGGQLRVERSNGNRINEAEYDPAAILGVRGQILF